MKKISNICIFLLIILIGILTKGEYCYAKTSVFDKEEHDYQISQIDTTVNVSESNMYNVCERLTVDHYNNEEICKVIPLVYDGIKRNVFDIMVENESRKYVIYETKQKGNNIYIYFKNEYSLPTETFKISYSYDMGYDYDDKKDMFYFDFLGKEFNQDIGKVSFTINLPYFFDVANMKVYSDNSDNFHDICALTISGKTIHGETREPVTNSKSLVASIKFDDGYFRVNKTIFNKITKYTVIAIIAILALLLIILIKDKLIILYYYKNSTLLKIKNKLSSDKIQNIDISQLNPMEIAYIENNGVSAKDVLCMLYYWENKKYIDILREGRNYKISFNEIFIKGPEYEVKLYEYFYDMAQNRVLYLSCIDSAFNIIAKKISEDMVDHLVVTKKIYNCKYRKHGILFRKIAEILFSIFVGLICYKVMGLNQVFYEGAIICYALTNTLFEFLATILNFDYNTSLLIKYTNILLDVVALVAAVLLIKNIPSIEIYNYDRLKIIKWEALCITIGVILVLRLSFNNIPFTKKGLKIKHILDNYKSELKMLKTTYTTKELCYAICLDVDPILKDNRELLENEFCTYSSEKISIKR